MYVILAKIHHSRLEPYVLIDNPNYNPAVRVGRFSGRPIAGHSDFVNALVRDMQANGQRNPICVWEVAGKYYVAYGAARVRAARSTHGLEFLDAIISGPERNPPQTIEPIHRYWVDKEANEGPEYRMWEAFKDPPLHWRIEPEGFLYFDGCVSGFDEAHNPEGAKALRDRGPEVNNGLSVVRSSVPPVEAGEPSSPPSEAPPWDVEESKPTGANVTVSVDNSGGERTVLPSRDGQRRRSRRS